MKPYHLFNYYGQTYVINIEKMTVFNATNTVAEFLKGKYDVDNIEQNSFLRRELKKMGLLSDCKRDYSTGKVKREHSFPTYVMMLFLTQKCNLNCVYCYGEGGEYGKAGNMDKKTAFQAVDWLVEMSEERELIKIGLFGGEPFLEYPLMKAVVKYAKNRARNAGKRVSFTVTTNATLLDNEKIHFLKEEEISVVISFDGSKELQDLQRPYSNGKGSYDSTIPKIKKLLAVLPETIGHAVVTEDNDYKKIEESLYDAGFCKIQVVPASSSLFNRNDSKHDYQLLMQALEHEAADWLQAVRTKDSAKLRNLKNNGRLNGGLISLYSHTKKCHNCGAGVGLVAVSVTGDVYLCQRFVGKDEYKLGDIYSTELNTSEYQKSPTIENEICSSCFAKYYCAGGCKQDNLAANGSIDEPSEDRCQLKRRELELAAYILCNLKPEEKNLLLEEEVLPPRPCLLDF